MAREERPACEEEVVVTLGIGLIAVGVASGWRCDAAGEVRSLPTLVGRSGRANEERERH